MRMTINSPEVYRERIRNKPVKSQIGDLYFDAGFREAATALRSVAAERAHAMRDQMAVHSRLVHRKLCDAQVHRGARQ